MANEKMQAARIHDYGGAVVIRIEEAPRPSPGAGEVLIRLEAAGVNPADWKMRQGLYRQFMPLEFPWIPGLEGAGTIEAVGPGVTGLAPGQAVYGPFSHTYAQYTVAPVSDVYPMPRKLTVEQAASVPIGVLTAWQAVVEEAEVKPGQRVLVQGGAGGVGMYVVQLAKWKGAHVTATTSTANLDFVKRLGADDVIDYTKADFQKIVKGLDAVIDTVGGELIARSLPVVKDGGILVTVAGMVDPEMGAARNIRAVSARRGDADKLNQVSDLLESGKLVPNVGKVFPLAQARQAHELSQTGHGRGRIVLRTT